MDNNEHIGFLRELIDENCGETLLYMKEKLFKRYGINITQVSISRHISNFSYSFKLTLLIPERRNYIANIKERYIDAHNYLNLYSEIDYSNIYVLDEVGFNISMRTRYRISLKGIGALQTTRGLRSRNISYVVLLKKKFKCLK